MGIFSEEELAADAVTEQTEQAEPQKDETLPEAQTPPDDRLRDETGKFAAKPAEDEPREGGQVPQGALHAEREKRKAETARADASAADAKRFREQLDAITAMRQQVNDRKPEPLPEGDDAGVQHLRERLAQLEQQQTRFSQQSDNERLDQAESQQLQAAIASSESEFRSTQPDYDAAIQYVIEARARELQLHGLNPVEVQQAVAEEAQDIVRSAIRQGRSPAEMAYQIAQSRGYRPPTQQANTNQGGAAAILAAIESAKGQSRSLGQARGSTPQTVNAETIAAMSDDEFAVLYSTPAGKAMIDSL